jgi:hypothetical protein
MNERIARMDMVSGAVDIIPLARAISDLSGAGLYCELAERLRHGEAIRLPGGRAYCALSSLGEDAMDQLPASAAN